MMDFREPGLETIVQGHEAFVHLGFVVLRGRRPEQEMFDMNVTGSLKARITSYNVCYTKLLRYSS